MKKLTELYEKNLKEDLLDSVEAAEYLNAALEDGSYEVFLMALKDVAEARGLSEITCQSNLNREKPGWILSADGNHGLITLNAVLHSIGLKLAVEVEDHAV